MTTSKHLQPELFESGSALRILTTDGLFTTPVAHDADAMRTVKYKQGGSSITMQLSASLRPDTPVSPSHSPGSDWARRMTGISGRSLRRWLPTSRLAGVFSRMFTDTSRWGSTMCWLTWKRSVTPAGRSLFLLRPSAPRTGEIASGFWPTPETPNGGRAWPADAEVIGNSAYRPNGQKVQIHLHHIVEGKMLPTPKARDWKNTGGEAELRRDSPDLNVLIERMMPTPRAEGFDAGGHRGTNDSLHSAVKATTTGKLSAAWVSRLQGYPDFWMDDLDGESDPMS